ncbi:PD-(D/E)XK nuclease family protein [Candidatus Uabimicrobium amorphum]|uniref:PD-(D/E)XK endonuclease-like domain-containing protein n=1 Tax=Uabimicrobium amorphum TaxID=2596890 RepID=A0A5S9IK08_UABAM|nr:PD-(D/E)XK nuclease family protein [Candidatus Uabimicrobium amorphum]BBM82792.1 hypothetical protein UABAM_01135 [Candidatus Uabimicrobium amorphum]
MKKLILGSYRCIENSLFKLLQGRQYSNALSPVAIIAESTSLKNHLQNYIVTNLGNITNIYLFTLSEFIERSLLASRENFLPQHLQSIVVEEVLQDLPPQNYFAQINPQTIAKTIAESIVFFQQMQINLQEFTVLSQRENHSKWQDFIVIFNRYREFLHKHNFVDFEQGLLCDTRYFLSFSAICLYGFYEHNPCEYKWRMTLQQHPQVFCYTPFRSLPYYEYAQPLIDWHYEQGFEVFQAQNIEQNSLTHNFFSRDTQNISITTFKNELHELYNIPQTREISMMNFAIPEDEKYRNGIHNTLCDLQCSLRQSLAPNHCSMDVIILQIFIDNFSTHALCNLFFHPHFNYENFSHHTSDNLFILWEKFAEDFSLDNLQDKTSPEELLFRNVIEYLVEVEKQLRKQNSYKDYMAILSQVVHRLTLQDIQMYKKQIAAKINFLSVNHKNAKKILDCCPEQSAPENGKIDLWQNFIGRDSKFLAVLGASASYFSSVKTPNTIFNDDILSPLNCVVPNKVNKEKLLLCLLFDSAQEIIFSYPRQDFIFGKEQQPCSLLHLIIKFEQGEFYEIHRSQFLYNFPKCKLHTIIEYDLSLHDRAVTQNDRGALMVLYAAYPEWKLLMDSLCNKWQKDVFTEYEGVLSDDALQEILQRVLPSKMSEVAANFIEAYARCPYQFFLEHVLQVIPNYPKDVFIKDWQKKRLLLKSIRKIKNKNNIRSVIEQCIAEDFKDHECKYPMIFEIEKIRMMNTIEKYVYHSLSENVIDHDFFVSYRDQDTIPITIDADHTIRFTGKIDQVNTTSHGHHGIQYHLKNTHQYKNNCFYGGTQLQLATELMALQQRYDPTHVEHRFIQETGDYKPVFFTYDKWQDTYDKLQKICYLVCRGIESGFFAAAPEDQKCRKCNYSDICGPYRYILFNMKRNDSRLQFYQELKEID